MEEQEDTEKTESIEQTESTVADERYRTGAWRKKANYECLICPFASIDLDTIKGHILATHPASPVPTDRFGNEIA